MPSDHAIRRTRFFIALTERSAAAHDGCAHEAGVGRRKRDAQVPLCALHLRPAQRDNARPTRFRAAPRSCSRTSPGNSAWVSPRRWATLWAAPCSAS